MGALVFAASSPAAAPRQTVVIGKLNWSGAVIISHVMKYVLEEKLAIPTVLREASIPVLWRAMAEGTMDVYPDLWMPNQQEAFDKTWVNRARSSPDSATKMRPRGSI